MGIMYLWQDRNTVKDFELLDADDKVIEPGAGDEVRATILRLGMDPVLTVASDAPTDNGSTFAKGEKNRLTIVAADAEAIEQGAYTLLVDLYQSVGQEWTNVDRQIVFVERT